MLIGIANAIKLRDDAIPNLLSVALVSRRIYMIAMPLIYKSIRIDISEYTYSSSYASSRECINRPVSTLVVRLAAGPSVRAMVRSIHVFSRTVVHPNTLALLQSMVPNLSQLESFSWDVDGSFPAAFLEPLRQRWPKSHLHIRTNFYKCNIAKDWISLKLEPHMLCSLQVCMPDGAFRGGEKRALAAKKNLFWVLKNCPGLQSLTTYPQEGYNAGSSGLWYDMKLEDPLPQLSDLSVTDKTFETEDLVYWGAKGGWLRLERLTICNHRLLDGLHGCEESLRSINLINAGEGYEDSLLQICSRTTMLTELKVRDLPVQFPLSALEICGPSLKSLAIHFSGGRASHWDSMQQISLHRLLSAQRCCPGLTNLAVNLLWPPNCWARFPPCSPNSSRADQ